MLNTAAGSTPAGAAGKRGHTYDVIQKHNNPCLLAAAKAAFRQTFWTEACCSIQSSPTVVTLPYTSLPNEPVMQALSQVKQTADAAVLIGPTCMSYC